MVRFSGLLLEREKVYLHLWEELVATYLGVRESEDVLIFLFNGYELIFSEESLEAKILKEHLTGLEGKIVGILKTDIVEKPLLIRSIVLPSDRLNTSRKASSADPTPSRERVTNEGT